MFKSIRYLRCEHDKTLNKELSYYHLVDDEFECDAFILGACGRALGVAAAVAEYHKRNLPIIKNLYLLNNFLIKESIQYWSFESLLDYQNKYIDERCPILGINFSKDIYPKLLDMHKELSVYK